MNLLLIDDQPNVLSALLQGIPWRKMGFTSVFTATSAAAARLILKNNPVDIVISDIEMPNKDGLSLLSWAREQGLDYECILLTSHADFFYAKQAISLGVSEYIIQPARNEDVIRAWHTMPLSYQDFIINYLRLIRTHFPGREMKILFWGEDENSFSTVLFEMDMTAAEPAIEALYQEMTEKTGCDLSLFYTESRITHLRGALDLLLESNRKLKLEKGPKAVCLSRVVYDPLQAETGSLRAYEQYGRLIHEYIRLHIGEPLTRTQLAEELHLSADHISYIIKSVDNMSCKELITRMKMDHAQDLLRHSKKPIGEVAQACGYDSFAYFSKVYKDTFGETPSAARGKKN